MLQARANKLEVEGSILTLEKRIGELENTVCALLGIAPVKLERGVLADQHFPDSLSAGLPLSLVGNRPDVREAEFALMQSFYATGEARSAFYPRITLSGTIGWTNHAGTISNPGTWLFNAVGSLVQPLFHKGENVARLKIARAQQQEALLQFRQSLLDAGNEVNNALILWQTARKRLGIDRKRILNLKAAVWNTKLLMKYGRTHYWKCSPPSRNFCRPNWRNRKTAMTRYRASSRFTMPSEARRNRTRETSVIGKMPFIITCLDCARDVDKFVSATLKKRRF